MVSPATDYQISNSSEPADREHSGGSREQTVFSSVVAASRVNEIEPTGIALQPEVRCEFTQAPAEQAHRGLQAHLVLLQTLHGWDKPPAQHAHPQLRSEPDD